MGDNSPAGSIILGSLATGAFYLFYRVCINSAKAATHIVNLLETLPTRDVAGAKKDLLESGGNHETKFVKIMAEVAPAHQQAGKVRSHFLNANVPIKEGALYEMKIMQRNLVLLAENPDAATTAIGNRLVSINSRVDEKLSHHYNIGVLPLVLKDKKSSGSGDTLVIEKFPDSFLLSRTYPVMSQVSERYLPHLPVSGDMNSEVHQLVTIDSSGNRAYNIHTDVRALPNSTTPATSDVLMGYLIKEYLLPFGSSLLALGQCHITPSGALSMSKTLILTNKSEKDILNSFKSSASLSNVLATIFKCITVGTGVLTGVALFKYLLKKSKSTSDEDDDSKKTPKQQED